MPNTTRRILSQLGHEPQKFTMSHEKNESSQTNQDFIVRPPEVAEKKLTFEALSQLCMNAIEKKQSFPDKL